MPPAVETYEISWLAFCLNLTWIEFRHEAFERFDPGFHWSLLRQFPER